MNVFRVKIPKSIILLIILSVVLNILRIIIWDKISFIYILWNIFLALLPFLVSSILLNINNQKKIRSYLFFIIGIIWLLLIPNAPYIITDFIHIGEVRAVPELYDSFLIFSSAWVGLLLGLHSINHIEKILETRYKKNIIFAIITIILIFISFGIYLGRFLRFNSWDVFARPQVFLKGIVEIFANTKNMTEALLYTLLFFFFMLTAYFSWKWAQVKS